MPVRARNEKDTTKMFWSFGRAGQEENRFYYLLLFGVLIINIMSSQLHLWLEWFTTFRFSCRGQLPLASGFSLVSLVLWTQLAAALAASCCDYKSWGQPESLARSTSALRWENTAVIHFTMCTRLHHLLKYITTPGLQYNPTLPLN